MKFAMVGLGKMGGNMVRRIYAESNHEVVVYDRDQAIVEQFVRVGATGAFSLEDMVRDLSGNGPRVVWIMVPAGDATQQTVKELAVLLEPGDVIIDGGNSKWTDDRDRQVALRASGIHYVDVGTSGGVWGLDNGYCMMVGGDDEAIGVVAPILDALAPPSHEEHGPGWLHVGPTGTGHYVKMIHNGIEYGMMRALTEGFALLDASEFDFDHAGIAHLWMQGSVIRSWLVELMARAFEAEGTIWLTWSRWWPSPVRVAGPSTSRSGCACRRTSSPPRSTRGSPRRGGVTLPPRARPRCATSSVGTP